MLSVAALVYYWRREAGARSQPPSLIYVLPANPQLLEVEPRGFEPLTTAIWSQYDGLLEVSRVSKIPANSCIFYVAVFSTFQLFRSGYCTVTAQESGEYPEC